MKPNFLTLYCHLLHPKGTFEAISKSMKERIVHKLLKPFVVLGVAAITISLKGQDDQMSNYFRGLEISGGFSYLIYQSGYGFKGSQGAEFLVSKRLGNSCKTEMGFRTNLNTFLPEGFIRGAVYNHFNRWVPLIGIETGISKRADFESSSGLLKEAREAMLKDIGYYYLAIHIEMVSFNLKNNLNISLLEFDVGTHYRHLGRTLRAQSTLIRIRKAF